MFYGKTLAETFGPTPGWLARSVPDGQNFDFVAGQSIGPAGVFVRSAESRRWFPASQTLAAPLPQAHTCNGIAF